MKLKLDMMVQDISTAERKGFKPYDRHTFKEEVLENEVFLNGPVCRRLAVVDLTAENRSLRPGAIFIPPHSTPGKQNGYGTYDVGTLDPDNLADNHHFLQVNVFATVLLVMEMFEGKDVLGRRLRWAFDSPQLLLVPQAGIMKNAFYERHSRSLQFFSHLDASSGKIIHAALSSDVIAHETGHAILDGIAPDLYDALTPQSLALHEAVADLTAAVIAFRNPRLRKTVLDQTNGSLKGANAFAGLAEEFGEERGPFRCLRSLDNKKSLAADAQHEHRVDILSPHSLCQVVSGALYGMMIRMHEDRKQRISNKENVSPFSASGKALYVASEQFKRMIFRALDYLPPGEVTFADYGRAILAADCAAHPDKEQERNWLIEEFVTRGIVPEKNSLDIHSEFDGRLLDVDLEVLKEIDWIAYEFAERHRQLLNIPARIPFSVRPRLDVTKRTYRNGGWHVYRELLLKVSWQQEEDNPLDSSFPGKRLITVGSTIVLDWETNRIIAVLTSTCSNRNQELNEHAEARTGLLKRLADAGELVENRGTTLLYPEAGKRLHYINANNSMTIRGMRLALDHAGKEGRHE